MITVACLVCKKELLRKPSQIRGGGVFCSKKCYGLSLRVTRKCMVCETIVEARNKTCSRSCANKLRLGSTYKTNPTRMVLKTRLAEERGYKCELCPNKGKWKGKPITLHLDHIDGDKKNNALGNLRLLCPNCHSQTETYAGRNIGKFA